ncbi:glycoside hydrolase family 2 protein [Flavobacterium fluviatile]|uniref:glycoside hydrolase family 2 protein n=1 Tax=Flavobacterium fluviatile TaxID=1862387 RepID=UPI0013D83CC1|nr:glycoside hydrolase family 2 TIM barrel-domain containing protein [Flavobacterium fluviatile]
MKTKLIILVFLGFIVSNAQTISLNGKWKFKASNTLSESELLQSDFSNWDTMQVPGNWDTHEKYATYVGKGYYQKDFRVPQKWQGKQIRVQFEAVYETAMVWVNGKLLGKHVGGYLPFEFNIAPFLKLGESNSIIVMADNSYKRGAWWAWGGISREVWLVATEDLRFVYQHIASIPDFEKGEINFSIKYKVENNGTNSATAQILPKIKGIDVAPVSVKINRNATAIAEIKFKRKLADFKFWHFDSPNLYQLTSELQVEGKKVDVTEDNFGIRKFEVRGEQFYLNNQAVRMNGVNRVHDHPKYGNTEPDGLIKKDMKDIQSLGCTFSRLMHAPLSKNLLDYCDKNGFLLVEEIPVWGDDDPQSFPNNPVTKKWMADMIERDFNHPSVVAWSVGNELRDAVADWDEKALTKDQYDYVNEMLDYVASLDTTRLKTYVTITSYRKGEIGTEPYEKVDFISMNSYGNAPVLAQKTHEKFPGKPIFVSEIGLSQIGNEPNSELRKELVTYIKELKQFPWISGVSLWSYNDYRSNYKGTPTSGYREWGIVDAFRKKKKKAYVQLKALYKEWEE